MGIKAEKFKILEFGSLENPLHAIDSTQSKYIQKYLVENGALSILIEPHYFDRDYLSEFSVFYSQSVRGYPNICQRVHFFSFNLHRNTLRAAIGGSKKSIAKLQKGYLGFSVIRPLLFAPFGKTVLSWYPDRTPNLPRTVEPSREYICHLPGFELNIHGLAWQQQDAGVSACATIALWTILHSSAFGDYHAIPTTAQITQYAHRTASLGARVFPSTKGLHVEQILEAVKENGLDPIMIEGDKTIAGKKVKGFTKQKFSSSCTAFIRSGYPVLILGELEGVGGHAVCGVGFREASPLNPQNGRIDIQDQNVDFLYIHDDNLGPNVRFQILPDTSSTPVQLKPSAPNYSKSSDPTSTYPQLTPSMLIAAVHRELRTSPDTLHIQALNLASNIQQLLSVPIGITIGTRFVKISSYLTKELHAVLSDNQKLLANVRLSMFENVPPMCLHLGLVRIGYGITPLLDILYDTSDSESNLTAFCHVIYIPELYSIAPLLKQLGEDVGVPIKAF